MYSTAQKLVQNCREKLHLEAFPNCPLRPLIRYIWLTKSMPPLHSFLLPRLSFTHFWNSYSILKSLPFTYHFFFVKNGRHPKFPCWAPHPSHQSHQSQLFRSCASSRTANLVKPAEKRSSARSSCGASGLDAFGRVLKVLGTMGFADFQGWKCETNSPAVVNQVFFEGILSWVAGLQLEIWQAFHCVSDLEDLFVPQKTVSL